MARSKKKIEICISFFGIHVMTLVRMCGFEASDHVDLRAYFRIFADTKWQELPGAYRKLYGRNRNTYGAKPYRPVRASCISTITILRLARV